MRSFLFALCSWLLVGSGTFLVVRGGLDYWDSQRAQHQMSENWTQEQRASERALDAQTADSKESGSEVPGVRAKTNPARLHAAPLLHAGETVARLSIPRLSTVLYVVEGTNDRDLKRGPGHLEGSVLPGQDGNCVIAGHRDTHFNVLKGIQKGDEILVERVGHKYVYKVDEMSVITPDNTACLRPTKQAELNLITCFPFQFVGSAPRRFVVRAKLEAPQV